VLYSGLDVLRDVSMLHGVDIYGSIFACMDEHDTRRERAIELERRRRERGIELTVQVWYDDDGVKYNRPRIITLKEGDRLFEKLNRLVPVESWGVLCDETGRIWYQRRVAANPTTRNRWAEFDPYEAQEFVDRRQVGLHDFPNPADIPTIYLQDIRHIEKMPIDGERELGDPGQQLLAMSECLYGVRL